VILDIRQQITVRTVAQDNQHHQEAVSVDIWHQAPVALGIWRQGTVAWDIQHLAAMALDIRHKAAGTLNILHQAPIAPDITKPQWPKTSNTRP
jgi:hypothetical protein